MIDEGEIGDEALIEVINADLGMVADGVGYVMPVVGMTHVIKMN